MTVRSESALVLMATFNGERYLRDQLNSIYEQDGVKITVVCRDDGSTDCTLDILAEFSRNKGLLVLKDAHKCGSAAKNFRRLILDSDAEHYDIVLLSDQDDIWLRDKVSTALRYVRSGVALFSSSLIPFSDSGRRSRVLKQSVKYTKFDHLFQGLSAGCTYGMSMGLFSEVRSIIGNNWFETNDFSHDWLVYTVARSRDLRIHHRSSPLVLYRQHDNNVQGASYGISGLLYRLKNINTGWYSAQISINKLLFHSASAEVELITAFENRNVLKLVANITQLRRSIFESIALILLSIFGGRRR